MTKTQYEKMFNELVNSKESTMLNLVYVSLISSDTVTDLERCNRSKDELEKMLEGLNKCNINHLVKEKWKERIETGLEICEKDRQNFNS